MSAMIYYICFLDLIQTSRIFRMLTTHAQLANQSVPLWMPHVRAALSHDIHSGPDWLANQGKHMAH